MKLATQHYDITAFGPVEDNVVAQTINCLEGEEGSKAVICADNHLGYSQPVGVAVAYRNHISVSGVGYDIGCGNKAVLTDLDYEVIAGNLPRLMDEIVRRISFGMGRNNNEPVDHPVLDEIAHASFRPQRKLLQAAGHQLGTVGAGNHYVDLFVDDRNQVWVGVHFGSRGFGHKTASGFLAMAKGLSFDERAPEGEMMSPPVLLEIGSELGDAYIEAMTLAGRYAHAGRDIVVDKVLEILGARKMHSVHNHHNFAWRENHEGEDWWVVRKGCTPAYPGQLGFVGATMGETSVILEGTVEGEKALYSTVHGAGRLMSRTRAAGKIRRRKRYACMDRDCDRVFDIDGISAHNPAPKTGVCPDHPQARVKKIWITEQKTKGEIDFPTVQAELVAKGVVLRGGAADEAPGAYKRLDEVLALQGDTIRVTQHLRPIGVAMAGPDIFDPFKD